jgi:hypothetical protein
MTEEVNRICIGKASWGEIQISLGHWVELFVDFVQTTSTILDGLLTMRRTYRKTGFWETTVPKLPIT